MKYTIENIFLYLKTYNISQYNEILKYDSENEFFYIHIFTLGEIDYLMLDCKYSDYDSTYSIEINKQLYLEFERKLKLKNIYDIQ